MKQYFLFAVLIIAVYSTEAQRQVSKKPPLTKEQQWFKKQLQAFYTQHNVNIIKETVIKQFVDLIQLPKEKICPRAVAAEKLKLDGERLNHEKVKLKWYTISQRGGKKFAIQRLFYNSTYRQFEHVGYLNGLEKTVGKAEYEMLDNNNSAARTYYRLQVLDTDGKLSYSETISVDGYTIPLTVKALPNPTTTGNVSLELTGYTSTEDLKLMVMDAKGSMVYSNQHVIISEQGGLFRLPNIHLTRGVYHVKVIGDGKTSSTTFIVQ